MKIEMAGIITKTMLFIFNYIKEQLTRKSETDIFEVEKTIHCHYI